MDEPYQRMLLTYLSNLSGDRRFERPEDLEKLAAVELLQLAETVDDRVLPWFVSLLKGVGHGETMFNKLMGDHEEDNRELVDAFFERYMRLVMASDDPGQSNPLSVFIPPSAFQDLAFLQSRQAFFLRQTIETINAYLKETFGKGPVFAPGEQERAWKYFWDRATSG